MRGLKQQAETTCNIISNLLFYYVARPERFELPTAWFVVSSTIANCLFFNTDYWNARCPVCTTMQDDGRPNPARVPQATHTRSNAIDLRYKVASPVDIKRHERQTRIEYVNYT